MTKDEYKERVTPDIVRQVFGNDILDQERVRYVITVGGKIVTINGKCFYDSRQQASRSLYNSLGWKVKRILYQETRNPETDSYYGYWRQPDSSNMWKAFKEAIVERYGYKIIPIWSRTV